MPPTEEQWNQIGGAALGIGTGQLNNYQTMQNQNSLQGSAIRGQMQLANHQLGNQLALFNATGYEAQVRQMKQAGLNPALMYKGGGAGGSVATNTPSISQTAAPKVENKTMEGMALANQTAVTQAEIQLKKEQARLVGIQADNEAGVNKDNTVANTAYTNLKAVEQGFNNGMAQIRAEIAKHTQVDATVQIQANAREAIAKMESSEARADIDQETIDEEIYRIGQESIGAMLRNKATRAGINLTRRQTTAITEQLTQGLQHVLIARRNANTNEKNADTNVQSQLQDEKYKEGLLELGNEKLTQDMLMGVAGIAMGQAPQTIINKTATDGRTTTEHYNSKGKLKGSTIQETSNRGNSQQRK